MEQAGKAGLEAELSRAGLRHEDFALHVRRGGLGGINKGWESRYAVRVTYTVTENHRIYWGGPGEDWVAKFATDFDEGMYRGLARSGARLPDPVGSLFDTPVVTLPSLLASG